MTSQNDLLSLILTDPGDFMKSRFILFFLFVLCLFSLAYPQYTNVRVSSLISSSPPSFPPEEVTIAVNPTDPMNLIAGANLRYVYFSTDGGWSWTENQLPSGTWGDPCVIFDANGHAYYAHLANLPSPGYFIDRITVHRSSNGGKTWYDSVATPVIFPKQQDKEWMACDYSNTAYHNNIYMAWTEFDVYGSAAPTDSSRILFARSTDGGTTWSLPMKISDKGGDCIDDDNTVEGAVPAVGPNGEVYTAWSGPLGIMFDRSFDGGVSFGNDIFVSAQPGGWAFDIPGISRCNGLPITACDVSISPYRGTVYVLWSDQRSGLNNTDVFLSKSTNQGSSWSTAKKVNGDGGTAQQFFPWLAVDQSNGYLYAAFYDRRNYTAGDSTTDVFVARSTDAGDTWSNFQVSQVPFLPRSSVFFGDYMNIAASNGKVFPIWMRLDTLKLSVWTALIDDVVGVEDQPAAHNLSFELGNNYPNPFNPSTTVPFTLAQRAHVRLKVFDMLGRHCATLVDRELPAGKHFARFYVDDLPSGSYVYELDTGAFRESKKLVIAR